MVEFIRPEEYSVDLLGNLYLSVLKENTEAAIYILKKDKQAYYHYLDQQREKKITKLLKNVDGLDPKVLKVYSSISSASQMVIKGGINPEVADFVSQSTASLVDNTISSQATIATLSKMIGCDETLYDHSATVAMLGVTIGLNILEKPLGKKEARLVGKSGLFHDVGKTCVPSAILNKPGRFTPEEFEVMKTHADLGQQELHELSTKGIKLDERVIRVAGEHHENFDGSGYPCGRAGRLEEDPKNGIHFFTRIITIADVYSALLMRRVYKDAYDAGEAIEIMNQMLHKFDPDYYAKFYESVKATLSVEKKKNNRGKILIIDQGKVTIKE